MPQDKPLSCCDSYERLDLSKVSLLETVINWSDINLICAILFVIFNNVIWHAVAYYESRTHKLSERCKSPYVACYVFMFIYLVILYKQETWFHAMLKSQPTWHTLSSNSLLYLGHFLVASGAVLIGITVRSLGLSGTFLGEIFGIQQVQHISKCPSKYCRPLLGAGSFTFHVGFSVVAKCQAGFLISFLIACGHFVAFFLGQGIAARVGATNKKKLE